MSSTTLDPSAIAGPAHNAERQALRKAARASFMGNFVEWFDYAAYGYLATIIAATFFPQTDKTTGLLATFAVFALSFLVRPLGASSGAISAIDTVGATRCPGRS